ncbi:MAG: hypothetical protein H6937_05175 [Burkholderiales bacterium]|nr:hypothetical protein [Burkholderiales bacterium]
MHMVLSKLIDFYAALLTKIFLLPATAFHLCHVHSKAGVFAVREGPVLFKNLIATPTTCSIQTPAELLSLVTTGDRYAVASRGAIFSREMAWH